MTPETRTLSVGTLTRVEGEGALHVTLKDGALDSVELSIYEPPRFFEAFLRGRAYTEPPDLTARVCGICPVAYQVSACNAIEDACGVQVDEDLVALRRLLYCGEWINSHVLHIYLLHAPDFLGYPDIIAMSRDHAQVVERGLSLKKAGNQLMEFVGGRAIHPVNVRLGGFYSVPTRLEFRPIAEQLRRALDNALATVDWVSGFDFPDLELEHEFLALTASGRYPIENGTIARSAGPSFSVADFTDHVVESQVPYSTALHATLDGGRHLTGPVARYSLNSSALSPIAAQAAARAGLSTECRNPFRSIIVRAVGIEPGHAAAEDLDLQGAAVQVDAVDVGDLQFAARRGLQRLCDADDIVVVEVQPDDRVPRFRRLRLFLEADRLHRVIEGDDAVAFGIAHRIGENRGALAPRRDDFQSLGETVTEEDVVAEHEADRIVADEIAADQERLRQSAGIGLDGVGQRRSPTAIRRRAGNGTAAHRAAW